MRSILWKNKGKACLWGTLLLAVFFLMGCTPKADPYERGRQLLSLMWNVNYETFSAEPMTEFAEECYEEELLRDFLTHPEEKAGVLSVREDRLHSFLVDTWDEGTARETYDGREFLVQKIRCQVYIEHFRPEYPEGNFFEEGKTFMLLYEIAFVEPGNKIYGFSFTPVGEEFLPAGEKTPLTAGEQAALRAMAGDYLSLRFDFSPDTCEAAKLAGFYDESATRDFVRRDGLTAEYLENFQAEVEEYHVTSRLTIHSLQAGEQKRYLANGENNQFYYWVEAEYTYTLEADPAYFARYDLPEEETLQELICFVRTEEGFLIDHAEYF